jgi:urease accessory protein
MPYRRAVLSLTGVLAAGPALAHVGAGATHGFAAGFAHPLGGLDHLLAMVTVGLLAACLGGRAIWVVPTSFIVMMLAGAMLGVAGLQLPAVELVVAGSVVVLGAAVVVGKQSPLTLAAVLAGSFALFHGFAHGSEMPPAADAGAYAAGFTVATLLLHTVGLGIGRLTGSGPALVRAAGAAVAAVGLVLAFQVA